MNGLDFVIGVIVGGITTLFVVFGFEPFLKWLKQQYNKIKGKETA